MTREEAQAVIMNEQKCIDRADRCNRDCGNCDLVMDEKIINEAYNFAIKALEQTERKTGKWKIREDMYGDTEATCSECGFETVVDQPGNNLPMLSDLHFCPSCGAKMEGEEDD